MKRILSIFLVVLICFCVTVKSAFAGESTTDILTVENCEYGTGEKGYDYVSYTIKNNSKYTLSSIAAYIVFMDNDKNVIDEQHLTSREKNNTKVKPGGTTIIEAYYENSLNPTYTCVNGFSYCDNKKQFTEMRVSEPVTIFELSALKGETKKNVDVDAIVYEILSYKNNDNEKAYSLLKQYAGIMTDEQKKECLISCAKWACIDVAENKIKSQLKSPRSYYQYSGSIDNPWDQSWQKKEGMYIVTVKLKYGATNSLGGEVTDESTVYVVFKINMEKTEYTILGAEFWLSDAMDY